jgi:opacity protein-like surface antigen
MYWLVPFFGLSSSYVKARDVTVQGEGNGFKFNNLLKVDIGTVEAMVGVPIGPVRAYGHAGMNYTRAAFTSTETINATTAIVDGITWTVSPGGTQTTQFPTQGWGWQFGGGVEVWLNSRAAIYGEMSYIAIRTKPSQGAEGTIDDALYTFMLGLRIRVGG